MKNSRVKISDQNILIKTDSYKLSHWKQYPEGSERVYSYLEARHGAKYPKTVFFGLQYLLIKYLEGKVVTKEFIDEAEAFTEAHIGPGIFNRQGWDRLLEKHGGTLPISIRAVPEGTISEVGNCLMTIENTDEEFPWLTNYLETLLMQVWYPITVATQSFHMKKVIIDYLKATGTPELVNFKLHDFGCRGVSSMETARLGSAAHLLSFMGTDTIEGITLLKNYYSAQGMPGFSIPASEHSTITSWGESNEIDAMRNMLHSYPEGLVACVSDSYDIERACRDYWGTELKEEILKRNGTLVVRPDSGDPVKMVLKVLGILGERFGTTMNDKGFKVLPDQIRVIQGDGINPESLEKILYAMKAEGWSADNLAFGSGGALLQSMNRDTMRFAIKCSAIKISGEWREVHKAPASDPSKESKKGRLKLVYDPKNGYKTVKIGAEGIDNLREVFRNGELLVEEDFETIKERTNKELL